MSNPMMTVEVSRVINAPGAKIYEVLRDYHEGHKNVVPAPYFKHWKVLKGGIGEGTELSFTIEVYGQQTHYHQVVTEPEPGRVLRETDLQTAQYSEFTLEPVDDGSRTRVTILSAMPVSKGIKGFIERWFQPVIVRGIFNKELQNIADYVESPRRMTVNA